MATLNYRIHTSNNPMSREDVHFLTRGRRPTMRDYEAWSRTLPVSWGTVKAIFEFDNTWSDSLSIEPVYETDAHKAIREAWVASNAAQGQRTVALYEAKSATRRLKASMNDLNSAVRSAAQSLQSEGRSTDVQGLSLFSGSDPLEVGSYTDLVARLQRRATNAQETLTKNASELAYAMGKCQLLIPEMVANDPHEETCERPDYVIALGESFAAATVVCASCGHVVPPLSGMTMPSRDSLLGDRA